MIVDIVILLLGFYYTSRLVFFADATWKLYHRQT